MGTTRSHRKTRRRSGPRAQFAGTIKRMSPIDAILEKIDHHLFEFSKHAVDQSLLRNIRVEEIREAILNGEVIEDYPEDKYGPSLLILGFSVSGRPLHIHCSYPMRPLLKIITLYEPDVDRWIDFRHRKGQSP